jgi:hypothetical protein
MGAIGQLYKDLHKHNFKSQILAQICSYFAAKGIAVRHEKCH